MKKQQPFLDNVKKLLEAIEGLPWRSYGQVPTLIAELRDQIKQREESGGYPPGVYTLGDLSHLSLQYQIHIGTYNPLELSVLGFLDYLQEREGLAEEAKMDKEDSDG